jgi:CheY-like chemotaxis protein
MPDARAKLLMVDDEVSIRTSLSQIFSTLGYCVRSTADGFIALSDNRQTSFSNAPHAGEQVAREDNHSTAS